MRLDTRSGACKNYKFRPASDIACLCRHAVAGSRQSEKDVIKELSKSIQKQPVHWLAAGVGVIAVAVVARKLTESPARREQLVHDLHGGYDRIRKTGNGIWHDGMDSANSLQKDAQAFKDSVASTIDSHRKSAMPDKVSNHESAIAAFMATVVAKGVSSYFQWRSTELARAQGNAAAKEGAREESLDDMTVVELRKEAAQQDIEGRSSMNKDDLVEALK